MAETTFDEIINEAAHAIDDSQKFLYITRGKEFQEDVIERLESLHKRIRAAKADAIAAGLESDANRLLLAECVTECIFEFARMWVYIKNDEMDRAWDSLIEAQGALRHAMLVHNDDQLQRLNDRLHVIEDVLFPAQVFNSIGFTIEEARCSICNAEYGACDHLRGRVYLGQICARVIKKFTLKEVSIVDDPSNKHCRCISIGHGGGHRNVMTWRIVPEDQRSDPEPTIETTQT